MSRKTQEGLQVVIVCTCGTPLTMHWEDGVNDAVAYCHPCDKCNNESELQNRLDELSMENVGLVAQIDALKTPECTECGSAHTENIGIGLMGYPCWKCVECRHEWEEGK